MPAAVPAAMLALMSVAVPALMPAAAGLDVLSCAGRIPIVMPA